MATKAQIKREERARKAAAKVVHKALLVAFKEIARAECRAASTTPPSGVSTRGVTKTRAWVKAADSCRRLSERKNPRTAALLEAADAARAIGKWDAGRCAQLLQKDQNTGA